CFDEAITLDDENAVYYSYKGYALLALGEAEEALECFEEAIELDPEYKMAHEGRNRCLEEM
ncbi:MAG: tetratricopeptide repeat protein, partial [Spirochaetales bacterium]